MDIANQIFVEICGVGKGMRVRPLPARLVGSRRSLEYQNLFYYRGKICSRQHCAKRAKSPIFLVLEKFGGFLSYEPRGNHSVYTKVIIGAIPSYFNNILALEM